MIVYVLPYGLVVVVSYVASHSRLIIESSKLFCSLCRNYHQLEALSSHGIRFEQVELEQDVCVLERCRQHDVGRSITQVGRKDVRLIWFMVVRF